MSFGFSVSDFVAVGHLAWTVYKSCKGAGGAFEELSSEVIALHTAIREVQDEIENPDSILNRNGSGKKAQLQTLARGCCGVLQELDGLLEKYKSLGTKTKRAWDRVRFATKDLHEIRGNLLTHTTSVTLFLTTLGAGSLGRIEKKLDQLIEDFRAGRMEGTVLSSALGRENDEDESEKLWDLLKQEMCDDDLTQSELETHKHSIQAKLAARVANGDLEEISPEPISPRTAAGGKRTSEKKGAELEAPVSQNGPSGAQNRPSASSLQPTVEDDNDSGDEHGQGDVGIHTNKPDSRKELIGSDDYESEEGSSVSEQPFLASVAPDDSISHAGISAQSGTDLEDEIEIRKPAVDWAENRNTTGIHTPMKKINHSKDQTARSVKTCPPEHVSHLDEDIPPPRKKPPMILKDKGARGEDNRPRSIPIPARTYHVRHYYPPIPRESLPSPQVNDNKSDDEIDTVIPRLRAKPWSSNNHLRPFPQPVNSTEGREFSYSRSKLEDGTELRRPSPRSHPSKRESTHYKVENGVAIPVGCPNDHQNPPQIQDISSQGASYDYLTTSASYNGFNATPPPGGEVYSQPRYVDSIPLVVRCVQDYPRPGHEYSGSDDFSYFEMQGQQTHIPPNFTSPKEFYDLHPTNGSSHSAGRARGFTFPSPESVFLEFSRGQQGLSKADSSGFEDGVQLFPRSKQSPVYHAPESTIVQKTLYLTLEELFHGTRKIRKWKPKFPGENVKCPPWGTAFEISIKPGLNRLSKIEFNGVSTEEGNGKLTHFHFVIEEKNHPLFTRDGNDLHTKIEISLIASLCGWEETVRTIDHKQIKIQKTGLTQPGSSERFPQLGMPLSENPGLRGDFIVDFVVKYPMSLNLDSSQKADLSHILGWSHLETPLSSMVARM